MHPHSGRRNGNHDSTPPNGYIAMNYSLELLEHDYALLHGDSAQLLSELPSGFAHTCITSPPYWNQRRYADSSGLGNEATVEEFVEALRAIFAKVRRVLRDDGSLWLNIGDSYRNKNLLGIPWRVAFALQADGWILRNAIVWDKVKGNPCNAKDKLRNVHEMIFHFVQHEQYYYDLDSVRTPPQKPTIKNGKITTPTGVSGDKYRKQIIDSTDLNEEERANALAALNGTLDKVASGEMPDFRMIIRGTQRSTHSDSPEYSGRADELRKKGFCILPYHKNGTKPGDVWRVIPEDEWRTDSHFAVYPTELLDIPIKTTCPKGGIVLDPFVGSGTTIIAALQRGCKAIGIDASAVYVSEARTRIDAWQKRHNQQTAQFSMLDE
jgi:DNA modification methylase